MIIDETPLPSEEEGEAAATNKNSEDSFTDIAPVPSNETSFELADLKVFSDSETPDIGAAVKLIEYREQERETEQEQEQEQELREQEQEQEADQDQDQEQEQEQEPQSEPEQELEQTQESETLDPDPEAAGEIIEDEGVTSGEEPLHMTRRTSFRLVNLIHVLIRYLC